MRSSSQRSSSTRPSIIRATRSSRERSRSLSPLAGSPLESGRSSGASPPALVPGAGAGVGRRRARAWLGTAVAGVDPRRDPGGAGGLWHTAADPQEQQRQRVLARRLAARARAAPRHLDMVDRGLVRLGARAAAAAPQRALVGAGGRPPRRRPPAVRQRRPSAGSARPRRPAPRSSAAGRAWRLSTLAIYTRRTCRRCRRRGATARTRADQRRRRTSGPSRSRPGRAA